MLVGWGDEATLFELLNNDPVPVPKAYVPQALLLLLYYTSSRFPSNIFTGRENSMGSKHVFDQK